MTSQTYTTNEVSPSEGNVQTNNIPLVAHSFFQLFKLKPPSKQHDHWSKHGFRTKSLTNPPIDNPPSGRPLANEDPVLFPPFLRHPLSSQPKRLNSLHFSMRRIRESFKSNHGVTRRHLNPLFLHEHTLRIVFDLLRAGIVSLMLVTAGKVATSTKPNPNKRIRLQLTQPVL